MSLLIGNKLVVSMKYKLTDDEGDVLDSSENTKLLAGKVLNFDIEIVGVRDATAEELAMVRFTKRQVDYDN